MSERLITAGQLRALLAYDPVSGKFTWLTHGTHRGRLAGTPTAKGYIQIRLMYRAYKAHRLAWLYVHGEWPRAQLDHVNGIRADNRIANLREATNGQNQRNSRMPRNNTSGAKGVVRVGKRWGATLRAGAKHIWLGTFDTVDEAAKARAAAAAALHGEFARS